MEFNMRSNVIHILLASIAILLFSFTLIFAGFVALLFEVLPQVVVLRQDISPIPSFLVLGGLIAALVGVAIGVAALANASDRT